MAWEYQVVTLGQFGGVSGDLQNVLNQLGSVGWEVCGFIVTSNVGGKQMPTTTALLKRERTEFDAPDESSPGWKSDPASKFVRRCGSLRPAGSLRDQGCHGRLARL